MTDTETPRPPFPPFTRETALVKVRAAEDAWNSRDPFRVALAYTEDSDWRHRDVFVKGRAAIIDLRRGVANDDAINEAHYRLTVGLDGFDV